MSKEFQKHRKPLKTKGQVTLGQSVSLRVMESQNGGERGIRTPDTAFNPYNGLANRRLQPLGHLSKIQYNQGVYEFSDTLKNFRI